MLTCRHETCLDLAATPLLQELQVCRGGRLERVAGSVKSSEENIVRLVV